MQVISNAEPSIDFGFGLKERVTHIALHTIRFKLKKKQMDKQRLHWWETLLSELRKLDRAQV